MRKGDEELEQIAAFLLQFDRLKSVNRRTYINGGERVENSAEHSWHLALACWTFAEMSAEPLDLLRLIKLALLHDLGEIDAGDTFLYSAERGNAQLAERACVERLAGMQGNPIDEMLELWDEQEAGDSPEARLLKVVDRLLPFLHNLDSEGRAWRDNGIRRSQVLKMHAFIAGYAPPIHRWLLAKVDWAVDQGWLIPD